ncbi:aldo/keto reductase [Roseivirga sp.]|uniref:aldo/keto reductase n=1 Tax=Roseivirga sp. TaxID=1964215 RepID=UPI003B8D5153
MNYRILKKANLKVSEISLGGMSLGVDHAENARIIQHAFSAGINYFDTADIYKNGCNEETVGKAIKPFRKDVILATKVGNVPNDEERNWEWNTSKKYIIQAVEKSLKRLGTDYVDIYQLHGGVLDDNWEETFEAFEFLKGQGKILHYGISSIRPNVIRRVVEENGLVSNMIQYSLLDRRPEETVLNILAKQQVGVMVRGALAKGILAEKDLRKYLNYKSEDIELLIDKIRSFSIEKRDVCHVSLQWVLSQPEVTTVVAGVRNMTQLLQVLNTIAAPKLSTEELTALSNVLKPNRYTNHR